MLVDTWVILLCYYDSIMVWPKLEDKDKDNKKGLTFTGYLLWFPIIIDNFFWFVI